MTLFKSSFSFLILCLFVGCVKADKGASPESEILKTFGRADSLIDFNNRALFQMGPIELNDIQFYNSKLGKEDWQEPDSIYMKWQVCQIKDRGTQGIIRNHKFHIESELGSSLMKDINPKSRPTNPVTVGENDCLIWAQHIPNFSYVAASTNIAVHFEIQSLAGGLGTIIKRFGFNPWDMYRNKSKSKGWSDITQLAQRDWAAGNWAVGDGQVLAALRGDLFDTTATLQFRGLNIETVEKEVQDVSRYNENSQQFSESEKRAREVLLNHSGVLINVNFSGTPFVRFGDATNMPNDIDLLSGKFKVFMNLVASGATDDSRKYLLSSNNQDRDLRDDQQATDAFAWRTTPNGLLASVPMVLKNRTEYGRVELVVKIVPVTPEISKVKPFIAVFDLGTHDTWARRQTPIFKFDENMQPLNKVKYDGYIDALHGRTVDLTTVRKQDRFYFGPLQMRFVRIMPGETATDRTLQYAVRSCVEHGLYGTTVGRGLQFKIVTEDKGRQHELIRQTNQDGCVTWFGFLSHKYYRKEVLEKKIAKVQFVGMVKDQNQYRSIINKYDRDFTYYLNPWDDKFTFGWDEPDMPENYPQDLEQQRISAPVSQLFIADFQYVTMGFRYAVDRFLNLKVKKTVLLKIYPYVLKYNSIVHGRQQTEKVRDGIYLMKVALQKDYLDPAARGVLIYDDQLKRIFNRAQTTPTTERTPRTAYEMYSEEFGSAPVDLDGGIASTPRLNYTPSIQDDEGVAIDRTLLQTELRESRKEYISVQTKLVRVLGGMIITPVEFEMDDLRLMRIRNQFFIQLQTIDENRLRLATLFDETFNRMDNPTNDPNKKVGDIEARFREVFATLDNIESIDDEIIQRQAVEYNDAVDIQNAETEIARLNLTLKEAKARLYSMLGIDEFKSDPILYAKRLNEIREKLKRLQQYRRDVNSPDGLSAQSAFRNEKRILVNRLVSLLEPALKKSQEDAAARAERDERKSREQIADENGREIEGREKYFSTVDPFLKFFFMTPSTNYPGDLQSILDYRSFQAKKERKEDLSLLLDQLRMDDFSNTPLTPSFSFEMLRNDGEHDPNLPEDDGKSGLPSRTFVGPLTFIFNTNSSALRPTDNLDEFACTTATCAVPDMIKQGIPPIDVERAAPLDANGQFFPVTNEPIYDAGDSINRDYENNEYYGYLRAYHDMTVDNLIKKKGEIDENNLRKMEQGSQLINFTRTFKLKYVLLSDRPESRLKSINSNCAQTQSLLSINGCFTDITTGDDILSKDDFIDQINNRTSRFDDEIVGRGDDPDKNQKFTVSDVERIIEHGWANASKIPPAFSENFLHRMCFVLTENLFAANHFDVVQESRREGYNREAQALNARNKKAFKSVERLCHTYLNEVYGKREMEIDKQNEDGTPIAVRYPPIIVERKLRTYRTNDRYVYRGGKSLNINVGATFTISSSTGIKVTTTTNYKPYELATGGLSKYIDYIPFLGPWVNTIVGGFNLTRSTARDESAGRTDGTTIYGGTFLVNQQATLDMGLAEYERCMVARFHPTFMKEAIDRINDGIRGKKVIKDFSGDEFKNLGLLICTGKKEVKCLPINEKYYYLTQHFTEGDMLDTADLHNHPWLLQLRGYRDFQVFAGMIGAREVAYIDGQSWWTDSLMRTATDAATMKLNGSGVNNRAPELQVVNQGSDINWALDALSSTYFDILPTFPGLYTFPNEDGAFAKEWPYENTDPGQASNLCEQ